MPSIQDLPFEIVQNITDFLGTKDKLSCTVLRKSLYYPSLESLYQHVTIVNLVQFRLFLRSITHHRHHPNLHVKRLIITIGNWLHLEEYTEESTRSMTFTEFELLARYCVNLQTLHFPFYIKEYWEFMQELDFKQFWQKLNDIPATRDLDSGLQVYHDMASRLVKLDLRGPFRKPINLRNLIPRMQNLEIIRISDREITLDMGMVHLINNSLPRLRELDLRIKFTAGHNATILSKRAATVTSLHCDIDHGNSDWFSLIKTLYKNINSLSMGFKGKPNDIDYFFSMIPRVQDLIQTTNIQHIKGEYSQIGDMAEFAENFILETVYGYDVINQSTSTCSSTIVLLLDYEDSSDFSQYTNMLTSQFSKKCGIPQQHEFFLKCSINEKFNHNTMNFLSHVMKQPIHLQLTRLTLKRRYYLHAGQLHHDDTQNIYLDSILEYFTNLESLNIQFTLIKVDFCIKRHKRMLMPPTYDDKYTFSRLRLLDHQTPSKQQQHRLLRHLKIKSTAIHRSVYPYLFKKCPNLSSLCLQDCRLKDEETVLALEYLCLMNNVELLYFK